MALGWLRWRLFVATLRRGLRGSALSRFSRFTQPLGVVAGFLIYLPAFVVLALAGFVAGWAVAGGRLTVREATPLLRIGTVFFLLGAPAMALIFSGKSVLPGMSRLLLLPVPRRALFLVFFLAGLVEVGLLMGAFPVMTLALGLLTGGRVAAALASFLAGAGLIFFMAVLQALALVLSALVLRDRHRLKTLTLAAVIGIVAVGLLPLVFMERTLPPEAVPFLVWLNLPGEIYVTALTAAHDGRFITALAHIVALLILAYLLYRWVERSYLHLMTSTAEGGRSAKGSAKASAEPVVRELWGLRALEALIGDRAALVAAYQRRALGRTVSGKVAMMGPSLIALIGSFLAAKLLEPGMLPVDLDLALTLVVAAFAAMEPFNLQANQFAIDRGGLTQIVLLPLRAYDVVAGKAAVWCLSSLMSLAPAMVLTLVLVRPSPLAALGDLVLAVLVTLGGQLLLSPPAALAALLLPKAVDLDRPFGQSQPHTVVALLGTLVAMIAAALPVLLALAGMLVFDHRAAACGLLVLWTLLMAVVFRVLMPPIAELFAHRREALLLTIREH